MIRRPLLINCGGSVFENVTDPFVEGEEENQTIMPKFQEILDKNKHLKRVIHIVTKYCGAVVPEHGDAIFTQTNSQ